MGGKEQTRRRFALATDHSICRKVLFTKLRIHRSQHLRRQLLEITGTAKNVMAQLNRAVIGGERIFPQRRVAFTSHSAARLPYLRQGEQGYLCHLDSYSLGKRCFIRAAAFYLFCFLVSHPSSTVYIISKPHGHQGRTRPTWKEYWSDSVLRLFQ